ncbi:P-loop containing nucleoside triphosphate hydrolase protein [Gaertneriomyces semiglobifer]|nr:P-loop containing nucleoside triphosphate hydrolase protein [Gaertneriomyces semiglobifer]
MLLCLLRRHLWLRTTFEETYAGSRSLWRRGKGRLQPLRTASSACQERLLNPPGLRDHEVVAVAHAPVDETSLLPSLPAFTPTSEQTRIFEEIATGSSEVVVVDAKAGSGKTTTLLECIRHIPARKNRPSVGLFAYNRHNAELLRTRSDDIIKRYNLTQLDVSSATFHALGLHAWLEHLGAAYTDIEVHEGKTWQIMQGMMSPEEVEIYGEAVDNLVSKAKLHCLAPADDGLPHQNDVPIESIEQWKMLKKLYKVKLCEEMNEDTLYELASECLWQSMIWSGGLQPLQTSLPKRLKAARGAYRWTVQGIVLPENPDYRDEVERKRRDLVEDLSRRRTLTMDFDDMLYLPIIYGTAFPKFDWIMIDEAQDMSEARAKVVDRLRAMGSRVFLFGDHRQQIYQWAGSSSELFRMLALRGVHQALPLPAAKGEKGGDLDRPLSLHDVTDISVLPLSVCQRCPTSVIKHVQKLAPEIQGRRDAPKGRLSFLGKKFDLNIFKKGEVMVVSRRRRSLLNFAYYLLSHGVPVDVPGRMIGKGMHELITWARMDNAASTGDLVRRLLAKRARIEDEDLNYVANGRFAFSGVVGLDDALDSLLVVIRHKFKYEGTVGALKDYVAGDRLRDPSRQTPLTPVLLSTIHRARGLEGEHIVVLNDTDNKVATIVEQNLKYIAYTRPKMTLTFIQWHDRAFEHVIDQARCPVSGDMIEHRKRPYDIPDHLKPDEEWECDDESYATRYEIRYNPHRYNEAAMRLFASFANKIILKPPSLKL